MEKKILHILIVAGIVLLFGSCVNLKKMRSYPQIEIEMQDKTLVGRDGNINIKLNVDIPEQYYKDCAGIRFYPLFEAEEKKSLPAFIVEGWQHNTFNQRMGRYNTKKRDDISTKYRFRSDKGARVVYDISVPYESWMTASALYVDIYGDAYNDEIYLGRVLVSDHPLDMSAFIDKYSFESNINIQYDAKGHLSGGGIIFELDSDNLPVNTSNEIVLKDYVGSLERFSDVFDYQVEIYIGNSPEGKLAYNKVLGERRLVAIQQYLESVNIPTSRYNTTVVAEDWDGLVKALRVSNIENREAILEIISNTLDFDQRKILISSIYMSDWQRIHDEIFPSLRRGNVTVISKHKETIDIDKVTKMLSNTEDYKSLMLFYAETGDIEKANWIADAIPNQTLSDTTKRYKAMVYMKADRIEKAKALLKTIKTIPECQYALGVLQLIDKEYSDAYLNLQPFSDINSAIASIYVGDYKKAINDLLILSDSAERDYLMAIAYTKDNATEKAVFYLKQALDESPELKERALVEPNFIEFWQKGYIK